MSLCTHKKCKKKNHVAHGVVETEGGRVEPFHVQKKLRISPFPPAILQKKKITGCELMLEL